MRIGAPELDSDRSARTVSLPITRTGGEPAANAFTIGVVDPASTAGAHLAIDDSVVPFVPMAGVAALVFGQDLDVSTPISAAQALNARAALTLLAGWIQRRIPGVTGPIDVEPTAAPSDGVGLLFTRGIDSWSSLLEHRHRVTHLLFVDGVEPRMSPAARERVLADHESVATDLGLPLVTMRTNARDHLDPWCSWEYTHGAVLATAALVLAPFIGEALIASSHAPIYTKPWGTHPELDPLWSTPAVRFHHDGRGFTRWQKIERVAAYQPALDSLHVCWVGGGDRNCGRCHKCLVTMTALAEIGVLDRCRRFDAPLDVDAVVRLGRLRPGRGSNVVDLLCHLPPGSDLARAWVHVVDPAMLEGTPYRT
jgi:hypothetical protein